MGHIQKCLSHYIGKNGLKLVCESKQMTSAAIKEESQGSADQMLFTWLQCLKGRSLPVLTWIFLRY